jgi:predicted transcriptional regulator
MSRETFRQELARMLRDVRQKLSLSRVQVARDAGLSLFIVAGIEDGTVPHLEPYLPALARAYRLDEYAEHRSNGETP